jgi:hypothetical protein
VQAPLQAGRRRIRSGQIHGDSDRQPGRSQTECRRFESGHHSGVLLVASPEHARQSLQQVSRLLTRE